eukprot:350662-Chlamydomonas_euryale.AAC.2
MHAKADSACHSSRRRMATSMDIAADVMQGAHLLPCTNNGAWCSHCTPKGALEGPSRYHAHTTTLTPRPSHHHPHTTTFTLCSHHAHTTTLTPTL